MQQETGGWNESEDETVGSGTLTDDEEVTIPSLDRNREILDFPDNDIRDKQTLSNTQREDWLLRKEPVYGARPRQTGREDPPVMDNRPPMDDPFPDDSPEDKLRDGGRRRKDIESPVDMLVDTVSRIQKDMAILHEEN